MKPAHSMSLHDYLLNEQEKNKHLPFLLLPPHYTQHTHVFYIICIVYVYGYYLNEQNRYIIKAKKRFKSIFSYMDYMDGFFG